MERAHHFSIRPKGFIRSNQNILFYSKSNSFAFNEQFKPFSKTDISNFKKDENGDQYTFGYLIRPKNNDSNHFEWRGICPPDKWSWKFTKDKLEELLQLGQIVLNEDGTPKIDGLKVYLKNINGAHLNEVWNDINRIGPTAPEWSEYPTQKPEILLKRIIETSSNPGDIVFDCFMGSGTTQKIAMQLGRRFLGSDVNLGSIYTTTKRLLKLIDSINESSKIKSEENQISKTSDHKNMFWGFQVYHMNQYNSFRNPLEAKETIFRTLNIKSISDSSIFDGKKDARKVKILTYNRSATKTDLNSIISFFDKQFESTKLQDESDATTNNLYKILLICAGQKSDLKEALQKKIPNKLDVKIIDLTEDYYRNKFNEEKADIILKNNRLHIQQFYPTGLKEKFSESKIQVSSWKEYTDSVMIDFDYDGKLFKPTLVDMPDKGDFVKGNYPIPDATNRIKVKITDIFAKSLEMEMKL